MLRSNSCQKNKQLFQEEGGRRIPQQQSGLCSLLALGSGPFIRPVDSELHAKGRDVPLWAREWPGLPHQAKLQVQTRAGVGGGKATTLGRDVQATCVTRSWAKMRTVLNPNNPK